MKNIIIIFKSFIVLLFFSGYAHSFVSAPTPASSSALSQVTSSMSHSAVNSSSVINNSNSVTSNLISATELKDDIKKTTDEITLEVDETAGNELSDLSSKEESSEGIGEAMNKLQSNVTEITDEDYVMTRGPKTIVYDSGWVELKPVETGSNGLTYSLGDTDNVSRIFETGVIHQGRGKVYVNFDTDPQTMEAELFVKVTLKGQSEQSHEWDTGAVTFDKIPIVAEAPRRLKPGGSTDFDEFVQDTSSMQVGTDTLATSHGSFTKQQLMDFYNHNSAANGDAQKELFYHGKFATVEENKILGKGTIVVEGAFDAGANATDAGTTLYISTIERLEGESDIVGKALE